MHIGSKFSHCQKLTSLCSTWFKTLRKKARSTKALDDDASLCCQEKLQLSSGLVMRQTDVEYLSRIYSHMFINSHLQLPAAELAEWKETQTE